MNDMSPDRSLPPPPPSSQPQPQPMPPDLPLTATLEAQEWQLVLNALNELPMKFSRPVFDKLISQFQQR